MLISYTRIYRYSSGKLSTFSVARDQATGIRGCIPILFAVLMLWAGLSSNESIAMNNRIPLVFIHGIKGARLFNSSDQVYWLNLKQVLGIDTPNLALPLKWDSAGNQLKDDLLPKGVLEKITLFPHVFEKQIYGKWLIASQSLERPYYSFAYDWRRDNLETLVQFRAFIEELHKKHGEKIQIVAHSMGGLITFALLNQIPELIHDVFFVGVPFAGGIGFLPDLT